MFARPRTWMCALVGAVVLSAGVMAAEPKPAVVVSLASPDQLLADAAYLTEAVGQPDAGRTATVLAGPYLNGIDRTRPAGIFVTFEGEEPRVVGFVAVKDITMVIATLKASLGDPQAVGDDGWRFPGVFLKQQGAWTFVAQDEDHLKDLPKDPLALLGGLEKKYSVAARIDPKLIPVELKKAFLEGAKSSFDAQQIDEADVGAGADAMMQAYVLDMMTMMVDGTQEILLGWKIDAKGKQTSVDVELEAIAGSKLAQRFSLPMPMRPALGNFDLPGVAFYGRRTNAMSKDEQAMIKSLMEKARDEGQQRNNDADLPAEEREKRKARAEAALPLLEIMGNAKYLDQAAVAFVEDGEFTGVMGMSFGPDSDWKTLVKNMIEQMKKDEPDANIQVKYDIAKLGNVSLHQVTAESPEDLLVTLFGEKQTYIVGTAPGRIYVAVGELGQAKLRQILTSRAAAGKDEMYRARVLVKPFVQLAADRFDQPAAEAMLESIDDDDQLDVQADVKDKRFVLQTKVDEGVLRSFGILFSELARGFGQF